MYVQPFHQRIVAGTPATLSWRLIGADGEPADPGTVTVTVTRADGSTVVASAATSGTATAARTYALTAAQTAILDRLTVTWLAGAVTLATTEVDVAAAPWFSNAELRALETSLANESSYPAATLQRARQQVETFFERITHRRFSLGYDFRTIPGAYGYELVVPHREVRRVRSAALHDNPATAALETLTSTELAAIPPSPGGVIVRYENPWRANWVKIGYEHGFVAPPEDVKRAAMRLCREVLVESKTSSPDAAVQWNSSDLGWSAVFVTPGVRGAHTRLPWVNEVLDAWTLTDVGIG